ncbi:proton-coupled amino acid transporter-like protein CG1139 [Contarinia nasturtii]|uniref:proton-coupled amino acid transporter-like protein CG1139 n=1 Tax=Contarinia nasturtii TaxID=265458 RepID=UPI0012D42A6C|nr:proton-coupled amino acid transporter-like protein CG1139 [Contarinia nasturtii]XP_031641032.1 proton-coupled amino acid transporter-like protein CG1139 [Contarinia nasturtii]XP_031641033.1 proton-coupled amino acid transporter-like protein CG1139 [Contarinia nasturtii]
MSKTGHSNIAFVSDDAKGNDTKTHYTIELTEKSRPVSVVAHSEKDDYDPYKNRQVEHPTTNNDTLIHLLKGSLGTGILAMPNAFYNSGYIVGFVGTMIIGVVCTYCIHMLLRSHYELCKRKKVPSLTYPAIVEASLLEGPAWGRAIAPYIVDITNAFLLVYQLGACCIYVVFVASNIKDIADYFYDDDIDVRLFMVIILLPLILINWVRNLKYLAPFSSVANVITILSFGIIGYYMFHDPISVEGKHAVGSLSNFPLFFGTVLFALEAIGVIMPLENEMKTPKKFGGNFGVLNRAMIAIIFLYVGMGFFGYLKYGAHIKGSITLNLPQNELPAQLAKGMLALGIFITHGLACYVAIDITWNDYVVKRVGNSPRKLLWEYVVRTLLVLVTFLLAVAIPNLELFISLFGAFCLSALGLAFPAMIEYCTFHKEKSGLSKAIMVLKNLVIVAIGLAGLTIGTYTSLKEIIHTFFVDGNDHNY